MHLQNVPYTLTRIYVKASLSLSHTQWALRSQTLVEFSALVELQLRLLVQADRKAQESRIAMLSTYETSLSACNRSRHSRRDHYTSLRSYTVEWATLQITERPTTCRVHRGSERRVSRRIVIRIIRVHGRPGADKSPEHFHAHESFRESRRNSRDTPRGNSDIDSLGLRLMTTKSLVCLGARFGSVWSARCSWNVPGDWIGLHWSLEKEVHGRSYGCFGWAVSFGSCVGFLWRRCYLLYFATWSQ